MAKQEGGRISQKVLCSVWNKPNGCPKASLLGVGKELRLEREAWSMDKRSSRATTEYTPPALSNVYDTMTRAGLPMAYGLPWGTEGTPCGRSAGAQARRGMYAQQ